MWYFAWILGTLLACAFGVITRWRLSTWKPPKPGRKKKSDEIYRYSVRDNGQAPAPGASLLMALLLAGCIFWDPSRFAAKTSELEIWHGFLLMWAVCSGVIHGVGFRPRAVHWQGIFVRLSLISCSL